MEEKLDKSSKALMICDLTNGIVRLFGATFLVAYLLQVSNQNITQTAIYYAIVYSLLVLGSIPVGKIAKIAPEKRVILYRVGIIVKSLYILSIVLFKDDLSENYIYVAIFFGISEALYWIPEEVMLTEVVNNKIRKKYMSIDRMLEHIISIVVPIILGTSIELTSFSNMAIYIFILTLVQIVASLKIDISKFNKDNKGEEYSLKKLIKLAIQNKENGLSRIYLLSFLYGIIMDVIKAIIVIITVMTFKTSMNLGILTTAFSICSVIALFMFNKLYKAEYAKYVLILCVILNIVGVVGLLIDISRQTLIIYQFTYSITVCILEVMFSIKIYNIVSECHIENMTVEHQVIKEGFMGIGRVFGFVLMIIVRNI